MEDPFLGSRRKRKLEFNVAENLGGEDKISDGKILGFIKGLNTNYQDSRPKKIKFKGF